MLTTRRSPGDAPLPLALRSPSMLGANDGDHRAALAVTTAARWCVAALAATAPLPPFDAVLAALATAVALNTAAALDALAAEFTRWCEVASADPFDPDAVAPLMLGACDAAALCFHGARDLDGDGGGIVAHEMDAPPRRSEAVEGDDGGESPDAGGAYPTPPLTPDDDVPW